jgi:hypothetical protein
MFTLQKHYTDGHKACFAQFCTHTSQSTHTTHTHATHHIDFFLRGDRGRGAHLLLQRALLSNLFLQLVAFERAFGARGLQFEQRVGREDGRRRYQRRCRGAGRCR